MTSPLQENQPYSPLQVNSEREQFLLLDVRTPAEFRERHIAGSILQPLAELNPASVAEWAREKKACVVVCGTGKRARIAAEKLCGSGLVSVHVMAGGIQAWAEAPLPLVQGKKAISLERQVRMVAGTLVLTGAVLGYFVAPTWIALSGFVGAGLIFAGVTDTCGMGALLARMPWNK